MKRLLDTTIDSAQAEGAVKPACLTELDVLRTRAFEQLAKMLPAEKRKQIADRLRDALSRVTTRKS